MKTRRFPIDFAITFAVVFVVNVIAIYMTSLIRHGEGAFNWELTFSLAISLGIALALIHARESKEQ